MTVLLDLPYEILEKIVKQAIAIDDLKTAKALRAAHRRFAGFTESYVFKKIAWNFSLTDPARLNNLWEMITHKSVQQHLVCLKLTCSVGACKTDESLDSYVLDAISSIRDLAKRVITYIHPIDGGHQQRLELHHLHKLQANDFPTSLLTPYIAALAPNLTILALNSGLYPHRITDSERSFQLDLPLAALPAIRVVILQLPTLRYSWMLQLLCEWRIQATRLMAVVLGQAADAVNPLELSHTLRQVVARSPDLRFFALHYVSMSETFDRAELLSCLLRSAVLSTLCKEEWNGKDFSRFVTVLAEDWEARLSVLEAAGAPFRLSQLQVNLQIERGSQT